MAKIRFGYSDDFTAKNNKVGINTTEPQTNLDVLGVVKGQDLKVTGVSSLTAYEGFLKADHQIAENTTLSFDQGPVSSLSGEIIVGTGQTVTVSNVDDEFANANDGSVWSAGASNAGWEDYDGKGSIFDGNFATRGGDSSSHDSTYDTLLSGVSVNVGKTIRFYWNGVGAGQRVIRINGTTEINGGSGALTPGWDSYYSFTGTINTLEVKSANTGSYGMSAVEIDGEILIDGFSTLVDKSARAGGSEIECLKVFNTFTPPSGGTNERPYAPKPGELYYNYDFKTIEFFDGFGWRQVDYTSRSGRVVIAGGYGPSGVPASNGIKSMQSLQVMTLGNTQYFGELNEINTEHTGCGSEVRGVLGGGYVNPSRVDIIQYVTIASASNAIDFGNLTQGRNQAKAVSSSTRGIWAGGFGPSYRNEIDYVEISTVGNAVDFGDLSFAHAPGGVGNSPTRGVFLSGYTPSNPYSGSEFISIASKGSGVTFGECSALIAGGSCGSNTRGIFGGGYARNPTAVSLKTLQYVTMASFGNAIDFGNLVNNMTYASAGGNAVRGVFNGSDGPPYVNTNINYVSVTSLGDAQDFGDLAIKTGYSGAVSDSHGGLGGF